jgi:zinc protease
VTRKIYLFITLSVLFFPFFNSFAYDLNEVRIEKLENGLTLMILEDHTQPLISTQVLYKVGGRNECVGATGLAHFLEHMAFRATKDFPDTDVVSRIYAEGGEWHGYTWLDQTTYFETVPAEDFDLVLQIQADRMANTLISAEEVTAERGAVLTELYSYENDPASVLADAVAATAFQQHPYRFNVIGWPSDVERITHTDLVQFYKRFYNPSNAVLAISGDISAGSAILKVKKYFESIPGSNVDSLPRTIEPPQAGERRLSLKGSGSLHYFQISYKAPAANDPDYAAFLILQGILSGTSGVNFRQDTYEAAKQGSRLHGIATRLSTYFIPTANPYLFSITGRISTSENLQQIEEQIESKLAQVRDSGVTADEIADVRKKLSAELVFDIETTEDAAHQMAYWEGIGAFNVLQKIQSLVAAVTPEDVQRVARKYLQPHQRTIGWYLSTVAKSNLSESPGSAAGREKRTGSPESKIEPPRVRRLKNGIGLIVQEVRRTPTAYLSIIIPSNTIEPDTDFTSNSPAWGYTTIGKRFLSTEFDSVLEKARDSLKKAFPAIQPDPASLDDPETRLNSVLEEVIGLKKRSTPSSSPVLVVAVGDLNSDAVLKKLATVFGEFKSPARVNEQKLQLTSGERTIRIPGKAQSQLGYIVPAAPPSLQESYAWKILRYIMAHDYEGRLGKELISRRGLIYYIGSGYNSDGLNGWLYFTTGVNPDKLSAVRQKFQELMRALVANPPSNEEIAEAKNHLIGRRLTAYQSNEEISGFLAREWIEQGRLLNQEEFEKRIHAVTADQVRGIVQQFLTGVTIEVDTSN